MTESTQRIFLRLTGIVAPLLLIAGITAALLGVGSLAIDRFRGTTGLLLFFAGIGTTTMALLLRLLNEIANHLAVVRTQLKSLELLTDVADHLQAMRTQMGKGVFGFLG